MARLPGTVQEWTAELENTLQTVWERIDSPEHADAFFADLQKIVPVPLEIGAKLNLAQAMAALCANLHADDPINGAKKIVCSARREVLALQRIVRDGHKRMARATDVSRGQIEIQTGRECYPHWLALHQCIERCENLDPFGGVRLRRVHAALGRVGLIVMTPLGDVDYTRAIAILDEVLANWAAATGSKSGQRPGDGAVTDFMRRVEAILLDATGLSSTALGSGVLSPIIDRMADALPTDLNEYKPGMKWNDVRWSNPDRKGDSSTQRRVMRARKRPSSPR